MELQSQKTHYKVFGKYILVPIGNIVITDQSIINRVKFNRGRFNRGLNRNVNVNVNSNFRANSAAIDIGYMAKFFEEGYPLPPVIVEQTGPDQYEILDGRHRTCVSLLYRYTHLPVSIEQPEKVTKVTKIINAGYRNRYKKFLEERT
jgi:hypothetical protein